MEQALPYILSALPFLGLWFLFAGMETGVFGLSRWRIRQQMRQGKGRAALLNHYLENPERFFWTILVGNALASFASVAILALGTARFHNPRGALFWVIFGASVFLMYAFCDLLPKMLFRQFPNRLSMFAAVPFRFADLLLTPALWLIEGFTTFMLRWTGGKIFTGHLFGSREELRSVMHDSAENLSSEERAMINRVLDLQTTTLRQVATPVSALQPVRRASSVEEVLKIYETHQIELMPLWDEGGRKIVGVVDVDDLLFAPGLDRSRPVREFMRPPLFLSQEMKLEQALRKMQRSGHRLAIVMGPQSAEWGFVRVDDILRQLFGKVTST